MANLARTSILVGLVVSGCSKKKDDFMVPPGDLIDAAIDAKKMVDAAPDAMIDAFVPDGAPDSFFDHQPPQVTVVDPQNTLIYAGIVNFKVMVMDAEAVVSVTATVGGNHSVTLTQSLVTPGEWDGVFDSTVIAGVVAPSVVVRAINVEGLMTDVSFLITLDNAPPIVSLSPPKVRYAVTTVDSMTMTMTTNCSVAIDPISPDAPRDLMPVAQLIEFRARIVDLPNSGTQTSTLFIPKAGVGTAKLYVLDDSTRPLVVDTNGDGFCDSINPLIVPVITPNQPNEAAVLTLAPIAGSGVPQFLVNTVFTGSNAAPACVPAKTDTSFTPLCNGEPFQQVAIKEPITNLPEIYGIPPISGLNCMGFAFDARAANISDGWACVAVEATDALGNKGVSPPLRVCIDSDQNGDCATAGPPPNCTGTYNPATMTANTTACTFRPFVAVVVPPAKPPQKFFDSGSTTDLELIPAN